MASGRGPGRRPGSGRNGRDRRTKLAGSQVSLEPIPTQAMALANKPVQAVLRYVHNIRQTSLGLLPTMLDKVQLNPLTKCLYQLLRQQAVPARHIQKDG